MSNLIHSESSNSTLSSLSLAETIAKRSYNALKIERLLNIFFFILEFSVFFLIFIILYSYRVAPDYPDFNLYNPGSWLSSSVFFDNYLLLVGFIYFFYIVILQSKSLFKFFRDSSFVDDVFTIIKAVFISFLFAIAIVFLLKTSIVYSRILIVSYALLMIISAIAIRMLKIAILIRLRKKNLFTKNVLIIGAGKVGEQIEQYFNKNKSYGYKVIGFLDDYKIGTDILGTIPELEKVILNNRIDEIFITIPSERNIINQLLNSIRKFDVQIKIIPDLFEFVTTTIRLNKTDVYPYLEILKTPLKGYNFFLKRFIDIILSAIGIIIILPLFIVVGIFIKLESKGPILFRQKRVGKNGMPFDMFKFRSMVINAEELKEKLEKLNEADGPVFKIKYDPRITKVGRFIRKFSIDELPQLFNVLKGDMSLIGPRPPLPNEVEKYDNYQWRRLEVRPGITGLWQVSGRSELSFEEWVSLDLYYIENWSPALDVRIILKTIPAVIKGSGAY